MIMGRSKQEFKVPKSKIEEIAFDVFSQNGYEGTFLKSITEPLQITRRLVYYYYNDKQGLYSCVAKDHLDTKLAMYREIYERQDLSFFDKMREHLLLSAHNFLTEDHFFSGIQSIPELSEIAEYRQNILQQIHQMKIALVQDAIQKHILRPDTDLESFLLYFVIISYGIEKIKKSTIYSVSDDNIIELVNTVMNGAISTYSIIKEL